MSTEGKAELDILVEIRDALKNLDTFEDKAKKTTEKTQHNFDALKTVAIAALAVFSTASIVDFFDAGIEAANAQEKSLSRVAQQMKLVGDFSDEALGHFGAFADEMEKTTGINDDMVISQLAIAKSFNTSNAEAEKLVKAASELSAATGDSLDSSVEKLGKTLAGTAGNLSKIVPELKGLSAESLVAGDALDIVLKRFSGSAVAAVDNFSGSLTKAKNSFGNFAEAAGDVIIKNQPLITLLKVSGEAFGELEKLIKDNGKALNAIVSGAIKGFVVGIGVAIDVVGFFVRGLEGLVTVGNLAFDGLLEVIKVFATAFDAEFGNIIRGVLKLGEATGAIDKDVRKDFDSFTSSAIKSLNDFSDASVSATAETVKGFDEFNDGFSEFQKKIDGYAQKVFDADTKVVASKKASAKAIKEVHRELIVDQDKLDAEAKKAAEEAKRIADEFKKLIEDITKNPVVVVVKSAHIDPVALSDFQKEMAAGAVGFLGAVLNGASGAKSLISDGVGAFADALLPGIGPAVTSIVAKLAEGPEATKKFIKDFIDAVPDIMDAVAESIPQVVETLVDSLINEGGAVRIGVAIAKAMAGEAVFKSVGKQLGIDFASSLNSSNLAQTLSAGFSVAVGQFGAFVAGIPEALAEGANAILDSIQSGGEILKAQIANLPSDLSAAIKTGFNDGIVSIGTTLQLGAANFANAISDGFKKAIAGLGEFFTQIFHTLTAIPLPTIPTPPWLKDFIRAVHSISTPSSVGGSQGLIPNNVPILGGLATGGTIPPGFANDSFFTGLTSGENVVDTGTNARLNRFLDSQNGSSSDSTSNGLVVNVLLQILSALQSPQQIATSINIDGNKLADAILNLNRRNARLTV